ncbi:MAG TPA: TfuA-like protein [Myxococcales bacterium]
MRLAPGFEVRPPARQGDVWRALDDGASVIALIDGVFESQPSVWHREILDAISEGVPVVGGGSMGALRAAELHQHGMIGAGTIFRWYRDGEVIDDAEVALLHADAEHDFRPLTVPQVNVRWSAAHAVRRGDLTPGQARKIVDQSARIFYQDRTADRVPLRLVDLKTLDARLVLARASRLRPRPPRPRVRSSTSARGRLPRLPYDPQLTDVALRRALLAAHARELGLRASAVELRSAERRLPDGLRAAEKLRLAEELALERLVLDHAARMVSDGPSPEEALADELRLRTKFRA